MAEVGVEQGRAGRAGFETAGVSDGVQSETVFPRPAFLRPGEGRQYGATAAVWVESPGCEAGRQAPVDRRGALRSLARAAAVSGLAKGSRSDGTEAGQKLVGAGLADVPAPERTPSRVSQAGNGPLKDPLGGPGTPRMGPSGGRPASPRLRDFPVELATSLARRGATLMFHVKQWNDNGRTRSRGEFDKPIHVPRETGKS
jgi:hypothetical protein